MADRSDAQADGWIERGEVGMDELAGAWAEEKSARLAAEERLAEAEAWKKNWALPRIATLEARLAEAIEANRTLDKCWHEDLAKWKARLAETEAALRYFAELARKRARARAVLAQTEETQ